MLWELRPGFMVFRIAFVNVFRHLIIRLSREAQLPCALPLDYLVAGCSLMHPTCYPCAQAGQDDAGDRSDDRGCGEGTGGMGEEEGRGGSTGC